MLFLFLLDFYDYDGNKINDGSSDDGVSNGNGDSNSNSGSDGINSNGGWNGNNGSGGTNNNNAGDGFVNNGQGNGCKLSMTKLTNYTGRVWNPCSGQVLFYDDFQNWTTFLEKHWAHVERFPDSPVSLMNITLRKRLINIEYISRTMNSMFTDTHMGIWM